MANSPGRSIRAPAEFWKDLDAFAQAENMKPGPALVYAAKIGMEKSSAPAAVASPRHRAAQAVVNGGAKALLIQAEAAAAHLATPKKLSPKQREWRSATRSVQVGPSDPAPGSRLKSASKPARR